MEMKRKKDIQQKLKKELESLSKAPISDGTAYEAYFNLSGFLKVLKKMKDEAQYGTV